MYSLASGGCCSSPTRRDPNLCFSQTLVQLMFEAVGEMRNEIQILVSDM